jgi:hypothetical protein
VNGDDYDAASEDAGAEDSNDDTNYHSGDIFFHSNPISASHLRNLDHAGILGETKEARKIRSQISP